MSGENVGLEAFAPLDVERFDIDVGIAARMRRSRAMTVLLSDSAVSS
jgi:hypothetical protein